MMGQRISIKQMRKEAPKWVFDWQQRGNSKFPKWIALLLVGGLFALLLTVVQIRLQSPVAWAAPKASVICATGEEGRILTLMAREGGPFPSRFLPSQWEGAATLEREVLSAARWAPLPYVPVMRNLPEPASPPLQLAARAESVLPKRLPSPAAAPTPTTSGLVPVLRPLSGITNEELPLEIPILKGPLDATTTAGTWRFLLRLDAAGCVWDCISLAGGDETGPSPMEVWLRRMTFKPEPGTPSRWIAVEVGFVNPSATHGTDSR
jgi:hypothetical protein